MQDVLMDLAEHQPPHSSNLSASNWSGDDDSPAPSAYSGSEAQPLQHPSDADDVGAFQIVQVRYLSLRW